MNLASTRLYSAIMFRSPPSLLDRVEMSHAVNCCTMTKPNPLGDSLVIAEPCIIHFAAEEEEAFCCLRDRALISRNRALDLLQLNHRRWISFWAILSPFICLVTFKYHDIRVATSWLALPDVPTALSSRPQRSCGRCTPGVRRQYCLLKHSAGHV